MWNISCAHIVYTVTLHSFDDSCGNQWVASEETFIIMNVHDQYWSDIIDRRGVTA